MTTSGEAAAEADDTDNGEGKSQPLFSLSLALADFFFTQQLGFLLLASPSLLGE